MKIRNFRGDLTDNSAKKETLEVVRVLRCAPPSLDKHCYQGESLKGCFIMLQDQRAKYQIGHPEKSIYFHYFHSKGYSLDQSTQKNV